MRNIKRKTYKKIIKEFRKTVEAAQIQKKWLEFDDVSGNHWLMFVNNSIVRRVPKRWEFQGNYKEYYAFKWKTENGETLYFQIVLYGSPCIKLNLTSGIEFRNEWHYTNAVIDKSCHVKIVDSDDVEARFETFMQCAHNRFIDIFKNKVEKENGR